MHLQRNPTPALPLSEADTRQLVVCGPVPLRGQLHYNGSKLLPSDGGIYCKQESCGLEVRGCEEAVQSLRANSFHAPGDLNSPFLAGSDGRGRVLRRRIRRHGEWLDFTQWAVNMFKNTLNKYRLFSASVLEHVFLLIHLHWQHK